LAPALMIASVALARGGALALFGATIVFLVDRPRTLLEVIRPGHCKPSARTRNHSENCMAGASTSGARRWELSPSN